MKLKKTNAVLGLLSAIALLIHMGYNLFSYITFYYNPGLKLLTAMPFMVLVCAHAVCGMCTVFLMGDGTRLDLYRKHNLKTIIQRVSAALIFPLLFIHLKTYGLLSGSAEKGNWFMFAVIFVSQILFFAIVNLHTALSFSKGCITLGLISDEKKLATLDRVVWCIYGAVFLAVSVAVVRGQLIMFVLK
ncbi:hypothetical protein [Butyrivibrio sp. LC3010]|uniref:hypothetical protein n=1 Tax=Butyrivibrio sp. LC3010 TaxID=1280680 RepID=UPI0004134EB7|nr:hypothetical protein [Butyrivibrio sp. LC3010]